MIKASCKQISLVMIFGVLSAWTCFLFAQNSITGVADGRVEDRSGKPVAGATIRATYNATGKVLGVTSRADGSYRITNLAPGEYTLSCEHPDYVSSREGPMYIRVNAINPIGVPPFVLIPKTTPSPLSAKAMADAQAKAKLAKSKAEEQARASAAATARSKEAAAARAKADADLIAKVEEEKRIKAESERKAAEERRLRAEAELKARAEAERRAQAEAQALAEAEAQAKLDAELAAKAEADIKVQSAELTAIPTAPIEVRPPGLVQDTRVIRLVQSATPMRGGNFTEGQIQALPLSGIRTFDDLALLIPGVSEPPEAIGQTAGPGIGAGVGSSGQFSVNGMRSRANNFTVDGSDNNDQDVAVRRQGFLSLLPQSIESIQEFQVSTLLWDEELGRNLGSQVNAVSKTGSTQVHGQAYGFINDSRLNARNFFDYTPHSSGEKNPFTRLQTGVALAGPIVRDRTHFFFSYEHQKINALKEEHFAAPTLQERTFLGALSEYKIITSPDSDNSYFDYFVTEGATPLGANLLSLYPLPNNAKGPFGIHNFSSILPASGGGDIFSAKITHQFTQRHSLSGRYNFTGDNRELPSIKRAIGSTLDSDARNQNLSLIFDSTFSGSLANQVRFSYGRTRLSFDQHPGNAFYIDRYTESEILSQRKGTSNTPQPLTVNANPGPLGELIVRPFSPVGIEAFLFPQGRVNNTYQFADTFSKMWQKHTVKFGADIRRVQLDSRLDRNYRPRIVVNNGVLTTVEASDPADANSSFLYGLDFANIGLVPSILQVLTRDAPDSAIDLRFTEFNFFINDNFRVRPNLTLDFGLRYEHNTVPTEADGIIESALTLENLPPALATDACGDKCAEILPYYTNAVDAYADVLAGRSKMYDPDSNNFGLHVGFAWDPSGSGKTSVRGGYGIYYDTILGSVVSQSRNVFPNEFPFLSDTTFFGNDGINANNLFWFSSAGGVPFLKEGSANQIGGSPDDFAALVGNLLYATQAGGLSFTLPEKELRTPYVQQWHLSLERAFGDFVVSAAYVGTKGTKLSRMLTPNGGSSVTPQQMLLNAGSTQVLNYDNVNNPTINQRSILSRRDPRLGAYQAFANSANSIYHSLQLETRRRFAGNYSLTASYVWSHAIDDVSDIIATAGSPALPQDVFNLQAERGNAAYDVRHRFAASFIVDLPFFKGRTGSASALLGGWQISSIVMARTGQPFTLLVPFDANQDGNLSDRPSTTQGLTFFDNHQQRRIGQTADDVTGFFTMESASNGSVGRNTVFADGLVNWDVAIRKSFSITENRRLDFRTEFFNLLNRANFAIPVATIGDPGFGLSTNTITNSRMIQFALKFVF